MSETVKDIASRLAVLAYLGEVIAFGEEVATERRKKPPVATVATSSPRCKVCTSPNRVEYEEYYLACQDAKEVWAYSQDLGEDIPYRSFARHFQKHFNPQKAVEEKSRELFERAVKEKIDYAQKLAQKFLLADALADKLLKKVGKAIENESEIKGKELALLQTLLSELRQYAREIRSLQEEGEITLK